MKQTHIVTALLLCIALGNVRAQYYKTYTTTADGSKLMEYQSGTARTSGGTTLTLASTTKYQTVDGFGYAMTYSTCYNLMQMRAPSTRSATPAGWRISACTQTR